MSCALPPSQEQDLTESVTQIFFVTVVLAGLLHKHISHCTTNIYIWQRHVYSRCSYLLFISMNSCSFIYLYHNCNRVGTKLYYCILEKIFPKSEALQKCVCPKTLLLLLLPSCSDYNTGSELLKNSVCN